MTAALDGAVVDQLARAFAARVRATLDGLGVPVSAVVEANRAMPPGCCATHDHYDANEDMAAAFLDVMGSDVDPLDDAHCALWGAAWAVAGAAEFYHGEVATT